MGRHELLLLLVLAVAGAVSLAAHAHHASQLAAWRMFRAARATSALARTAMAATVITGVEWAAASAVQDWRLLVVLAGPGLAAGSVLARPRHRRLVGAGRQWWR